MSRSDFLDELITTYSYDEVYNVYELCINYYKSVTGIELAPETKNNLQKVINLRPPLSQIRDMVDALIKMFQEPNQ